MHPTSIVAAALLLPSTQAAETILGAYIFSRHGDRVSKATPPTILTDLGYAQVNQRGDYFRNRYISSSATSQIMGMSADVVKYSQIVASAPLDTVLFPSALGFLQGLYPPVGEQEGSEKLANGSTIDTPLNGYQLIPVGTVATGGNSESTQWLQGSSGCAAAITSSNNYFFSPEYLALQNSTADLYNSVLPVINATFNASQDSYKQAYAVYDLINVATIHNASINSSDVLTNDTLLQLRTLADTHEFNLAYNASDPVRAITGATLAAQILQALNLTITSGGKSKLNIQFGAYGGFQSFFGLAQLPQANPDFYGIPDYASTMTFELFTNAAPDPFPSVDDISVRFYYHNGSSASSPDIVPYPLFGQSNVALSFNDFATGINNFAVSNQQQWCQACGNSTGVCAPTSATDGIGSTPTATPAPSTGGGGVSKAVAGVIGAMVTLAVIFGVEALILLVAGLRVVSKKRLHGAPTMNGATNGVEKS